MRMTVEQIDALNKGDAVWQIGNKHAADRMLIVKSKGPQYVVFTTTISFCRATGRLSNNRYMYLTCEEMMQDNERIRKLKAIGSVLTGDLSRIDGPAELLTCSEVDVIFERICDRYPGSFQSSQAIESICTAGYAIQGSD